MNRGISRKATTIAQVARVAGVSYQTVSNVINQPSRVKPATAERVQAAIDALGYVPNTAARQLRSGQSRNIGVRLEPIVDGVSGTILDVFLHALTERAQEHGYRVTLFTAASDEQEIQRYQELHEQGQVDALILTSTHAGDPRTAYLLEHKIAFATFGRPWQQRAHSTWVDVDNRTGITQALAALQQAGHTNIGFIGWPEAEGVGQERYEAWREAFPYSKAIYRGNDSAETGAKGAVFLREHQVTAVICASDTLAVGALGADREHGNTLCVVGFDDTVASRTLGFSSVSQPIFDVARHCFDSVLAQLKTPSQVPEPVLLPSTFIARNI